MTEPRRVSGSNWLRRSVRWTTILGALAVVGLAVAIFVIAGGVDVAADKPDGWLTRYLLHFVFKRSEQSRSKEVLAPDDLASPFRVRLAAQHFDMTCANCHGRPGFGQSVIALSMSPRPQYLPKVVGQFTDAQLYTIVEHGVKFSGMPSWPTNARGDEVWSMVAFLRRVPSLDAKTYREMTALPAANGGPTAGLAGDVSARPADPGRESPPFNEFAYAAPAFGFSAAAIGETPAVTCARCHGADGSGAVTGGEAPNLTVHDPAYMQAALEAYTRGSRNSGFMQNIAAQLSAAQLGALARYYASLPVKTIPAPPANPALVGRGRTIAFAGVPEHAIPACASCHESAGALVTGAPHIAGQSATYLRRQLAAMARGGRGASLWWNPMPAVAHDLGKTDIAAVAAYYSGLPAARAAGGSRTEQPATAFSANTAADSVWARQTFATRCMKCHVHGGRGDPQGTYPDLTLQSAPYVAQALYAFRARARPNAKMRELVDSLSFHRMASLAAYVNGLAPQPALARPDPTAAPRGAAIATHGAPARGVPACLGCHGAKGVAALPLIPRLQGQNVVYLRNRLARFARPDAANLGALNPMPLIAGKLTDTERADLAAYFAAAPPLEKAAARP